MATDAAGDSFSEKAVETFRACARVPAATRAHMSSTSGGKVEVEVTWTQREIERGKKVSYNKSYFVSKSAEGLEKLCVSSCQADATNVVKVAPGHGGHHVKRVLLVTDKANGAEPTQEPQQFIEVWTEAGLEKTLSVSDIKEHGKINEDIHFGAFSLSSDGRYLLYVAERKKPKAASYFAKPPSSKEDPPPVKGAEHDYESNWGEQLSSVVHPVPVVLDWEKEQVVVMDTAGVGDISAGHAVWVPGDEEGVVFIGWNNRPRKLGFVYCICRNSAVYYANAKTGKCTALTSSDYDVYFPRFNPDGSRLVYFQAEAGGPHRTCAALMMMDWSSKKVSTLVDIVSKPKSPTDFPGFYNLSFPSRCWDSSGTRLLFHNSWGSLVQVTHVDTNTGAIANVSGANRKGAWLVLDVAHDLIVAQFASLDTCPQLFIGAFPKNAEPVVWMELCSHASHVTDGLTWELLHFSAAEGTSDPSYEGLLLRGRGTTPPPLVVFPHGGPHVATPADFLVWPICLAALGYAVLMVNYRGSMGFGEDSIRSLLGNVGTQDVQDVQRAAVSLTSRGVVDGGRVCVMGGSHGGFLTAHLIGQYPDFYKAAVIRNPVIDMGTMWSVSDIPDWCYVEGGLTFDPAVPPTNEQLGLLQSKSPITYVDKVQAPVLLNIGGCDLRCPPSQGFLYYNTLRAQGKTARLLLYPKDSHPITTVQSDADAFVNAANWFHQYTE